MVNATLQAALATQLRTLQEKYDFGLLALAASAIALSVHETRGASLTFSLIPLALATIAWCASLWFGHRRQGWIHAGLHANNSLLSIEGGLDPLTGSDPARIAIGVNTIHAVIAKKGDKAAACATRQFQTFVAGGLLYLTWHLAEMWLRTKGQTP